MKDKITFSSDSGELTREDLDKSSKMSEDYFGMEQDPSQMPATSENRDWIYKNIPDYLNIIRINGEIIGYAFLLPCTNALMEDFLNKRITESELFENIKGTKLGGVPEAIYLCASIVKEEFRRKGLATSAFVKAISKITSNQSKKPLLFCWKYSREGERVAKKVASATGLELRIRE